MENSIEEDIERLKLCSTNQCNICGRYEKEECMLERNRCEQHILSDYKKLQEEFKQVDHECERLEEKEVRLIKENEVLHKEIARIKSLDIYKLVEDWETRQLIPRQKIKDKIEKLSDESHAEELEDIMNRKNYTITELVQYVLQELLENKN